MELQTCKCVFYHVTTGKQPFRSYLSDVGELINIHVIRSSHYDDIIRSSNYLGIFHYTLSTFVLLAGFSTFFILDLPPLISRDNAIKGETTMIMLCFMYRRFSIDDVGVN